MAMDQHFLKNPCGVLVVIEATDGLEQKLKASTPVADIVRHGLCRRPQFGYIVSRSQDEMSILIAARKDTAASIECLHFESHADIAIRFAPSLARSRLMVCKVTFKQSIGHLGTAIVIAGVHGSRRTMNLQWKKAHTKFFNRLAAQICKHNIKFICGDFKMSLTDVPNQLARRGLQCDCVAWYPWQLRGACPAVADPANTPALGLDSCAIFYIGGIVKVKLHYGLTSFNHLCSRERADDYAKDYAKLDEYADQNTPGR